MEQLLLDLMAFREQALRLILDLSSTVITLLVSFKPLLFTCKVYVAAGCVIRTLIEVSNGSF